MRATPQALDKRETDLSFGLCAPTSTTLRLVAEQETLQAEIVYGALPHWIRLRFPPAG